MKTHAHFLFFLSLILSLTANSQTPDPEKGKFNRRTIASGLNDPWEIIYGPDKFLWITESKSYTVVRVDPRNGTKKLLLDLSTEKKFSGNPWPQGGLMGMALHPGLLQSKPYVYLAYVSRFKESKDNDGGNFFETKIVRYMYDKNSQSLSSPEIICDSIPGSNDHNGGRLLIAGAEGKEFLYYSVGDMGAGQYKNVGRKNNAQNKAVYEGKILRFNTVPDGDSGLSDSWIPNDNPFNQGSQNAVWTLGHRNPQGLAAGNSGTETKIYSSEHGPFSDDEVNVIVGGRNYGHPLIIGYNDNNYNGLAAGFSSNKSLPGKWHTTYPLIESENMNARKIGAMYMDPVKAFNPSPASLLKKIFPIGDTEGDKPEWPSEAPSSIAFYGSDSIPGWKNSLLITTLKTGKLLRLKLDEKGEKVLETFTHFKSGNRYRDIAVSPDGIKIYLITDKSSVTSGPTAEDPQASTEKGAILEFSWSAK